MFFKSFQIALLLGTLAFDTASAKTVAATRELSLFNPSVVPTVPAGAAITQLEARIMTNAKRLAAGLPLNPPHKRASRTSAARRGTPSNVPSNNNVQGYVQVRDLSTGAPQGYLSNTYNSFGEVGLTTDSSNALVVSLDLTVSGPINIQTVNGPYAAYPYLGAINGFSSTNSIFGLSSFNYAYIGATIETDAGAPAVTADNAFSASSGTPATVESGVWHYNPSNNAITLQWVNPDSSEPATYLAYTQSSEGFFITGDLAAWEGSFGTYMPMSFTFVPL